jgi:uncharacterized cupin superfamily protein
MAQPRIARFEPKGPGGKGLELWEEIPEASLIAGKPVQHGHYYLNETSIGLSAGVWDCTAMTGKLGPYPVNEFMILLEGAVTILDERGGATTIKAGESFILPKGLPCAWKQTGYVRKFFVIFDDSSGLAPAHPETLKLLRPDPLAELEPSAGPAAEVLLGPAPTQHALEYFEDVSRQWTVGVWDSTPYHRATIAFPRHELMHILDGEVTITEEGFEPRTFKAGDSFFVPMGTRCDWLTTRYIRKIYCIMQPRQAAAASAAAE